MTIPLNDLGLGRMAIAKTDEEIEYQPFEVSRSGLGVIARAGLKPGEQVRIQTMRGTLDLEIIDASTKGVPREQERYTLTSLTSHTTDLESIFADSGCYERINQLKAIGDHGGLAQFRNARFGKGPMLTIIAQTFGTAYRYQFRTRDISRSGMLMVSERDCVVPFLSNTLLEITIDPDCEWLKTPLNCIAKVIRRGTDADTRGRGGRAIFGVHFIELGDETQRMWRSLIEVADKVQTKVALLAS